jgi:hypothetical protein
MDDGMFLWVVPAMFLLTAVQAFTESRGPLTVVFSALSALVFTYLVITLAAAGGRPPAGLVLVTATGVLYLVATALRRWIAGLDVFLGSGDVVRGGTSVALVRARLNRTLRRAEHPTAPDPVHHGLGDAIIAAAVQAGRGDLPTATGLLDTALDPHEKPPSWPDARLGLLLYHRTIYSALATAAGDSPALSTPWRNDLDLARTVLPDVRLGWLSDAAVAWAEGRAPAAAISANAVRRNARGRWERDLATLIGHRWDPTDPYAPRKAARATPRTAWIDGLAARLGRIDTPAAPPT